jgi:hypothetical protein
MCTFLPVRMKEAMQRFFWKTASEASFETNVRAHTKVLGIVKSTLMSLSNLLMVAGPSPLSATYPMTKFEGGLSGHFCYSCPPAISETSTCSTYSRFSGSQLGTG